MEGAKKREKGREPRRETDVYVAFLEGLLSTIRQRHLVLQYRVILKIKVQMETKLALEKLCTMK